jgi:pSer/pThr/pTyr-binding forkhead associated (FHA) protein
MPFCPQCGIDNPATARYCDQCGAALIPVTASATAPTSPGLPAVPPPSAGAVICPQCGASAIPGEAFCDNCGAPLSAPLSAQASPPPAAPTLPYNAGVPAQPTYPPPQPAQQPPPVQPPPIFYESPTPIGAPPPVAPPTLPPRHLPPLPDQPALQPTQPMPQVPPPAAARAALAPARLVVAASGAVLPLPNSVQAIVGRADPVSKFFPDIDLTPHGALDHGVGRRHLRLLIQGSQIMAEDMESTNGTLINAQRLAPRQPQPLRDGDTVQVGKLILRFHLS